jgi:response regulator RpfG family c-di-GMP phosphodiesterase
MGIEETIPEVKPAVAQEENTSRLVYIVDDEEDISTPLAGIIQLNYYARIKTFETGEQCFEAFLRERPDLILTDWTIRPGYGGEGLVKRIRQHEQSQPMPSTRVVCMSGNEICCSEHGIDDYLQKPFDVMDLTRVLDKYLQRR